MGFQEPTKLYISKTVVDNNLFVDWFFLIGFTNYTGKHLKAKSLAPIYRLGYLS